MCKVTVINGARINLGQLWEY